jgi:hypothetical protein
VGRSFRKQTFVLRWQKVEYMKGKAVLVLKPHQVGRENTTPHLSKLGTRKKVVSFTADRKVSHWAGLDAVKKNISVSAGS